MKMKWTMHLAVATCITVALLGASQHRGSVEQKVLMVYELYSWQGSDGSWSFCVLPNTSSETPLGAVFNKKTELRGVGQLRQRISQLPERASVVWVDRLPSGTGPKVKGRDALKYPPEEIISDVKRFAEERKIKVFVH
jgi:hypothetical protein